MSKTLTFQLLGGLTVSRGGHPVSGFHSRKERALLCYLAITGKPHRRPFLAGLFWGNWPERRSLGNLRRALTHLRAVAGEHLRITRQVVEFDRESDYWLDVEVFEKLANWEIDKLGDQSTNVPTLREAVKLYRGDFLAGFYLKGCPAFEEWVLGEQERLRGLAVEALRTMIDVHRARGEYPTTIAYARQLLALDPWLEETHRELMRLLALTGQRSAALAQYQKCHRLLAEELGLEPLEETRALYQRLVDWGGDWETGKLGDQSPNPPIYQSTNLPFVGRGSEHAQLIAWWEAARRGEGQLILIEGEAGIGKTRLIEEITRFTEIQGAVVLRGRCYEFGRSVPYQPLAEALRSFLSKAKRKQGSREDSTSLPHTPTHQLPGAQSPAWLAELARLVPEMRELYPHLPLPMRVTGQAARQRLFEAVSRFLAGIPTPQSPNLRLRSGQVPNPQSPVTLFLDDLHWADHATLDLLHYLVRQLAGAPVWIVGAYRPEEVEASHPLTRLRQGLSRDHLVARLILKPLSPDAVEEIARSLVAEESAAALSAFLHRESEGNPFILTETVSSLQEQSLLTRGEKGEWQWSGPPPAQTLPPGVRHVVMQRVGRLSKPAQRLLRLAAVIGRGFDAPILHAAAGVEAGVVDNCLDEWLERRLIRSQLVPGPVIEDRIDRVIKDNTTMGLHDNTTTGLFDFSHNKIRATVYHAIEAGRRRMLHRRVGEALEKLNRERLEAVAEPLAYHYERAGVVNKALTYLPLAAARAAAVYANREALETYDRALALLPQSRGPGGIPPVDERRWEILLRQMEILWLIGEHDRAIAVGKEILEGSNPGSVADARPSVADARRPPESPSKHPELALNAVKWQALWQARAANEMSKVYQARRDYEQARFYAQEGYRLAVSVEEKMGTGVSEERARAMQALGEVERERGNLEAAQAIYEEALSLHRAREGQPYPELCPDPYRRARRRSGTAECLKGLGDISSARGYYAVAQERFQEALAAFRSLGDRQSEAACLNAIGAAQWREKNYQAAHQTYTKSMEICRAIGDQRGEASALNGLGLVAISLGDHDKTQQCWEKSVALYRALGLEKRTAIGLHNLGILHIDRWDHPAAKKCLEESLAIDRAIGAKSSQALDLGWLGKLHRLLGEHQQARHYLDAALALDREIGGSEEQVWHLVWRGAVACETGDLSGAITYLQEAAQLARERGVAPTEAYYWLAEVHLARGDGEAALAAARRALAESEKRNLHDNPGISYGLVGEILGSGLIEEAEDPIPCFERALDLLQGRHPFDYGVALRRYGTYLLHHGKRKQGIARLEEAQTIFEHLGAQGELAKVKRTLLKSS